MSKHLLSAFASDDSARFAQLLGAANDPEEVVGILTDIPDGLEGVVVAKLDTEAADRLLNGLPDAVVIGWLSSCSVDAARHMLARINHERSLRLIASIEDRSKRRGLRRLVEYQPGTIGELVQANAPVILDSTPVAGIFTEIQRQSGGPGAPLVVLRQDGTVSGVLDMVYLLRNRDPDARASDFLIPVKPAFAKASQASLKDREEWAQLTSLPVVDYDRKLVGYVSRSSLESRLGNVDESDLFLQSVIELSKQFFEFMAAMLVLVFDRRSSR